MKSFVERHLSQRVADDHPQRRDDQQAPEVHHQHVEDVPAAVHAAVEEGQPRGHEQHECRRDQHPRHILRYPLPLLGVVEMPGVLASTCFQVVS